MYVCACAWMPGFEKMEKGSLGTKYTDRTNPMDKHVTTMLEMREMTAAPMAPQMFGNAGLEHMEKYGACGRGAGAGVRGAVCSAAMLAMHCGCWFRAACLCCLPLILAPWHPRWCSSPAVPVPRFPLLARRGAGTKKEHFVKIAYKNHKHSVNNPYSQFRDVYTEEQIAKSPVVHEPLTKLQACSQGAPMLTLSRSHTCFTAPPRAYMCPTAPPPTCPLSRRRLVPG
jgi:hypothetical protein